MRDFFRAIIDDLRRFSAAYLDLGVATSQQVAVEAGPAGTAGLLLAAISRFTRMVPDLLRELEERADGLAEERPTRLPHRARLSNRVGDYEWQDGMPSPTIWLATEIIPNPPVAPLRWLLHLAGRLGEALDEARSRQEEMSAQIREARLGGLGWAMNDRPLLEARRSRLRSGQIALDRVRTLVTATAKASLQPRARFPRPYPKGRSWELLRRLLPAIDQPWGTPRERARHLLSGRADIPDLPFLYQRWCGLQIHLELEARGFEAQGDVVAALFGAGEIRYRDRETTLSMWLDSRLVAGERHPSGFTCVEGRELTPDVMLVTPGPDGPDAFILDPTLSADEDGLLAKGRYLDQVASFELALVAGVPTIRRPPLRSWAVAPIRAPINRILDAAGRSGRVGVVPLHPLEEDRSPLAAFLDDVLRRARAWSGPAEPR